MQWVFSVSVQFYLISWIILEIGTTVQSKFVLFRGLLNSWPPLNIFLCHSNHMELFSRRRWRLVTTQMSNKLEYCLWRTVAIVLIFNKSNHLSQYEPSSPLTKELYGYCLDRNKIVSSYLRRFEVICWLPEAPTVMTYGQSHNLRNSQLRNASQCTYGDS